MPAEWTQPAPGCTAECDERGIARDAAELKRVVGPVPPPRGVPLLERADRDLRVQLQRDPLADQAGFSAADDGRRSTQL